MAVADVGGSRRSVAPVLGGRRHSLSAILYAGILVSLVYVFTLDGTVRLMTNSNSATLGRDVVPWGLGFIALLAACSQPRRPRLPPMGRIVLVIVALALVQLRSPYETSLHLGLEALRPHVEFIPFFFLGYAAMRTERRLEGLAIALVVCGAANGILSLVQSSLSPSQLASWGPGYAAYVHGGVGGTVPALAFFNNQPVLLPPALGATFGFGGGVGVVALPFALALVLGGSTKRHRLFAAACLPLIVAATLTSQVRSSVVGAVVVTVAFIVLIGLRQRRQATRVGLLVAAAAVVVVVSGVGLGHYSSIAPTKLLGTFGAQRGGSLTAVPTYAVKYPLGAGLGSAGPAAHLGASVNSRKINGENEFLYLIDELGLPGLVAVVFLTLTAIRRGVRLVSARGPEGGGRIYLAAITAGLIGAAVLSTGAAVSVTPDFAPFLWLGAGVLAAFRPVGAAPSRLKGKLASA